MQSFKRILSLMIVFTLILSGLAVTSAQPQAECAADTDYLAEGEAYFADADYAAAAEAFACAVEADPLNLDAYRGQLEAHLYNGAYAEALQTFTTFRINVIPENADGFTDLMDAYAAALDAQPDDVRVMTGYSFALWYIYETQAAFDLIENLLEIDPENVYARVFHGSASYFLGDTETGDADFALALENQPDSADLHFIIADANLYGAGNVENALAAALMAQELGLDTPRLNAILGTSYFVLGDQALALDYFGRHIDTATVETVEGDAINAGDSLSIDILPGQTYTFALDIAAGETISLITTSEDGVDSIMVLATEDGTLVTGNDDSEGFNAGFEWTADEGGTYTLKLSTFEGSGTGNIVLARG